MRVVLDLAFAALLVVVMGYQVSVDVQSAEAIPYTTLDELSDTLADESDVVLVEFCVPSGCSRCEQMRTSIDRLAADQKDRLKVRRVNLSQHLQLMVELNLPACPSYVAFRDGEEVFRTSCPTTADLIASGLDAALEDSTTQQLAHNHL